MGFDSCLVQRRLVFIPHLCPHTREEDCNHQIRRYFGLNYSVYFINIVLFWILFHFLYSTLILIGPETCIQVSWLKFLESREAFWFGVLCFVLYSIIYFEIKFNVSKKKKQKRWQVKLLSQCHWSMLISVKNPSECQHLQRDLSYSG